jgi:hypothetical protein
MKLTITCPDCDNLIVVEIGIADCHTADCTDRGCQVLIALANGARQADLGEMINRTNSRALALAQRAFCRLFPEARSELSGGSWTAWIRDHAEEVRRRAANMRF